MQARNSYYLYSHKVTDPELQTAHSFRQPMAYVQYRASLDTQLVSLESNHVEQTKDSSRPAGPDLPILLPYACLPTEDETSTRLQYTRVLSLLPPPARYHVSTKSSSASVSLRYSDDARPRRHASSSSSSSPSKALVLFIWVHCSRVKNGGSLCVAFAGADLLLFDTSSVLLLECGTMVEAVRPLA